MTSNLSRRPKATSFSQLLASYVVFCDVRLGENDRSFAIKIMLRSIGAKVVNKIDENVTHVIFRNGSQKSLDLAKKYNIKVVSVLWLEAVRRSKSRVSERFYRPITTVTKDILEMDQFCHTVEEEYKQIIREEVAQLNELNRRNKSGTPSFLSTLTTNSKNGGLQIDFDSSVLQKSIYYELEKSNTATSNDSGHNENSLKENRTENGNCSERDSNTLFVNNVRKSVDSSNRETATDSDQTEDAVVPRPALKSIKKKSSRSRSHSSSVSTSGSVAEKEQAGPKTANDAAAARNISTTASTDINESVARNTTLLTGLSTTTKKRRKLYTPGRHNLNSMSDTNSPDLVQNKSVAGKKNYVPPYAAKLIDRRYTFTSIKKSNRVQSAGRTRRTPKIANETPANRLMKRRRPLKEIVANVSRNSGCSNNDSTGTIKARPQQPKTVELKPKPVALSETKRKREPERIVLNECSSSDFQSPVLLDKTVPKSQPRPKPEFLVVTNLTKSQSATVLNALKLLGRFKYEPNVTDRTTHVISSGQRTKNYLVALINGCWILSFEWIEASLKAKKWLSEEKFEMCADNEWVKKRRVERQLYGEPHKIDLFRKYLIYVGNFSNESTVEDFKMLIRKCGGNIVQSPFDANIIVGSCEIQVKDAQYVMKTWILDSIIDNKIIPIRKKYLQKTT